MSEKKRTPLEEVLCEVFSLLDNVVHQNGGGTLWYDNDETAHEALVGIARLYAPALADEFVTRLDYDLSIRDDLPEGECNP